MRVEEEFLSEMPEGHERPDGYVCEWCGDDCCHCPSEPFSEDFDDYDSPSGGRGFF